MSEKNKKPVMVEMFSGIGSQAKALKKLGLEYDIHILDWDIAAFYAYDIIHNGPQDEELAKYNYLSHEYLVEFLSSKNLSVNGKKSASKKYLSSLKTEALRKIYTAFIRTKNFGNIVDTKYDELPDNIEILTYSFPCQDLSIGGAWHGNMSGIDRNANNRSGMLWEVERLLDDMFINGKKLPKFMLMENVYNINSNRHKSNFEEWQKKLISFGYCNKHIDINANKLGMPQSRRRVYMLNN